MIGWTSGLRNKEKIKKWCGTFRLHRTLWCNYRMFGIEPFALNVYLSWHMLSETTVRELCERASREGDARKAAELLTHLRDVIEMESDETRLRIRQILLHYRDSIAKPAMEKPRNSISSFVAALVLGIRQSPPQGN